MTSLATGLGLYIHWPFCARICPYCDFNVYRPKGQEDALLAAILTDMQAWREMTGPRRLATIHFGGGTPSLLTGSQIGRLLEQAEALWGFEPGIEIGLEANPADRERYAEQAAAGINRLSVGVQSLDDAALKMLGRDHDSAGARAAIDAALAACERVSVDMIYALSGQTIEGWEAELKTVIGFGAGHISPYQLTIETGTAFGKRTQRGEQLDSPVDLAADLYELTQEICAAAGLAAYEISNHARTVADQSRHNRLYWEGGDWIGIGPGAHGRLGSASSGGRLASIAQLRPKSYIDGVALSGHGLVSRETLSSDEERAERILMGMRLAEGLDLQHLEAMTGHSIDTEALERLISQSLVERAGARVRLSPAGRIFADRISGELVP
tara:strand:+ start:9714 stop:10862 length:1149 start_codon:yes stop_codon:yes gene_type:complete